MEPWQVILLIGMIAFFLYFIVLLFVAGHGIEFAHRLRVRTKALLTVMSEKRRLLLLLDDELHRFGIPFGAQDETCLSGVKTMNLTSVHYEDVKKALSMLGEAETRLAFLAHDRQEILKDPQYAEWVATLAEIDRSIRQGTSSYNMDVAALNYWVSIPLAGWVNVLFGIRKRDPIV
ncbi:MAG: hypothetical protein ACI4UT_01400 [Candidatus Enteromonas sp.]